MQTIISRIIHLQVTILSTKIFSHSIQMLLSYLLPMVVTSTKLDLINIFHSSLPVYKVLHHITKWITKWTTCKLNNIWCTKNNKWHFTKTQSYLPMLYLRCIRKTSIRPLPKMIWARIKFTSKTFLRQQLEIAPAAWEAPLSLKKAKKAREHQDNWL